MTRTYQTDRLALDLVRAGLAVYVWCHKCRAFTLPVGSGTCQRGHYGKGMR